MSQARRLPVAVRAYVPPRRRRARRTSGDGGRHVLVFDTETTTDVAQRLVFGSYRVYNERTGRLLQEGLIAADELLPDERALLEAYVATHADDAGGRLRLLTRSEFVADALWPIGYEAHAQIVGFNVPFDLSRLAIGVTKARNGGFSLQLWESIDAAGRRWHHQWRPNITIKAYAAHRQFIAFTTPARLDPENRVDGAGYRGRFLDLHTAAFAFTDRSFSLDRAAAEFGLQARKMEIEGHGKLTEAYIDYNRQDVRLTYELYQTIAAELGRHPVELALEQAFSPAAVGKAYLRAMGVRPPLERANELSGEQVGRYTAAYFGGRAEVRIRRTGLPVRYVDFTSMYPTVFAVMGLWRYVIADNFRAEDATEEARSLLARIDREALLDPETWPKLAGVVCRVRPSGELLPVRGRYGQDEASGVGEPAWTIGLNHLESGHELSYMLADLVAAKLLGGTAPEILDAVRVVLVGVAPHLESIALRGSIEVEPADDLFRRAIEERQRVRGDDSLAGSERDRLSQFLKTFANGGSYGIFAEYHQRDPVPGPGARVEAWGLWPIEARVRTPEEPGEFCFPPLAASITAAARLLLALLEAEVEAAGGTYMACDTDSLLVVASRTGGLYPCPGGPARLPDGRAAVHALSHAELDAILARLYALNPYNRNLVPSLVKVEPENVGPADPPDEELYGYAISAKRYALYRKGPSGRRIVKASSHGLGMYRRPYPDPPGWDEAWPAWIEDTWDAIIRGDDRAADADPRLAAPAVSQLTVSSPHLLAPFRDTNAGLPYADQVKPFSFMLVGHVDPLAPLPSSVERDGLVPVAPYASTAGDALSLSWRNRRDGKALRVATARRPNGRAVRLKTYSDVVADYRRHPEHKSGDPAGGRGVRTSVGLLPRLHLQVAGVPVHIGKESNQLEEEESGAIVDPDETTVEYRDDRAEWEAQLPALRRLRDERGWRYLAEASGLSERALRYALNGGKMPHGEARRHMLALVTET